MAYGIAGMAKIERRTKISLLRGISSISATASNFKGLRFYPDGGPELSIAIFEYGGALFSLMPGGEGQIGYEADNFRPTDEQIESFQDTAEDYGFDVDIYS